MLYRCNFVGREIGALGITYPITKLVRADSKESARLKLYGEYEHIFQFNAKPEETETHKECAKYI